MSFGSYILNSTFNYLKYTHYVAAVFNQYSSTYSCQYVDIGSPSLAIDSLIGVMMVMKKLTLQPVFTFMAFTSL